MLNSKILIVSGTPIWVIFQNSVTYTVCSHLSEEWVYIIHCAQKLYFLQYDNYLSQKYRDISERKHCGIVTTYLLVNFMPKSAEFLIYEL